MMRKLGFFSLLVRASILVLLGLVWGWGVLAIYFSGPDPAWLKITVACAFGIALPIAFYLSRSFIKGLLTCLVMFGGLILWWQGLQPTNDKEWAADVARVSHGEVRGDILTMHNVRNFRYQGDKITAKNWESREYDLDKLTSLDLYLSYWASEHIAHTILSWGFEDGKYLAISIETRKDKSQQYSAIKGFFKQFELAYVVADERDIIRLRTNVRKERVYAYRLKVENERSRELLLDYLTVMNSLVDQPQFYDALTRNCTTTIRLHSNATASGAPTPMDWRILASGHLDQLLYEHQLLYQKMVFTDLRMKSRIDERMQLLGESNFSQELRKGLPDPNRSL